MLFLIISTNFLTFLVKDTFKFSNFELWKNREPLLVNNHKVLSNRRNILLRTVIFRCRGGIDGSSVSRQPFFHFSIFTFQFVLVSRRTLFSTFNFVLSCHLLCELFVIYLVTSYFRVSFHEAGKRWNCHAKRPVIEIYQQSLCARMCV